MKISKYRGILAMLCLAMFLCSCKADKGYFELMLDNTLYWVSATEKNFSSVCTIIERCKSSKISLKEFVEMKERRKWAWME